MVPSYIKHNDLKPEVSEADAHSKISDTIIQFIKSRTGDLNATNNLNATIEASNGLAEPWIDAMMLEGSHGLHPPCNDIDLIN